VFDPFWQAEPTRGKSQGGLGVGLTIVRRLMEMHSGTVEAHSAGHGQGSEFILRLPIVPPPAPEERTVGCDPLAEPTAPRRILVADDNVDSALSLAMLLKLMGNEVHTAHDGLEAVEAAKDLRPDLILLDIGMPRLNGYDAARRIRQEPWGKSVVLVALTGWGQEEDKRRSREAGFDRHLVKPVEPEALDSVLTELKPACP
jgi:CheY-like chemotaxis protein